MYVFTVTHSISSNLVAKLNRVQFKLAKQGAVKNVSQISYNNLLLSSHEITLILKKTVYI